MDKPKGLDNRLSKLWDKLNSVYPKLQPHWKSASRIRAFLKNPTNPKFTDKYIEQKIFNAIRISFRNQTPEMRQISSEHGKAWYPELHKIIHNDPKWKENQSNLMSDLNRTEESRLRSSKVGKIYGPKHLIRYNKSEKGRHTSKLNGYQNVIRKGFGSKGEERLYNHLVKLFPTYSQYQIELETHPYDMAIEYEDTLILIEFNGMLHYYPNNRARDLKFIKFANDKGFIVIEFSQNELRNLHGLNLDNYLVDKIKQSYVRSKTSQSE